MKVVFLDIDGVLNNHEYDEGACSTRIRYECIKQLKRIVARTDAKIVLSSAWRYMIHCREMTLRGFQYMLRTHGGAGLNLIGCTEADETCPECEYRHSLRGNRNRNKIDEQGNRLCLSCGAPSTRGRQVSAWLRKNLNKVDRYVCIDDDQFDFKAIGRPLVRTDGALGLTENDANRAIRLLGVVRKP